MKPLTENRPQTLTEPAIQLTGRCVRGLNNDAGLHAITERKQCGTLSPSLCIGVQSQHIRQWGDRLTIILLWPFFFHCAHVFLTRAASGHTAKHRAAFRRRVQILFMFQHCYLWQNTVLSFIMRINIEAQNTLVNKNSPSNTLLEYVNTPVPVISAAMTNGKANIFPRIGDSWSPAKRPKKVTHNPNNAANIYIFILSLVYTSRRIQRLVRWNAWLCGVQFYFMNFTKL